MVPLTRCRVRRRETTSIRSLNSPPFRIRFEGPRGRRLELADASFGAGPRYRFAGGAGGRRRERRQAHARERGAQTDDHAHGRPLRRDDASPRPRPAPLDRDPLRRGGAHGLRARWGARGALPQGSLDAASGVRIAARRRTNGRARRHLGS